MKELTLFTTKYKKLLVPTVLILSSLFLIIWVILPQISLIGEELSIIRSEEEKSIILTASLSTLTSHGDAELESDFATATRALPTDKQVALIFSALSAAASSSNTILQEFSLTVGGVYGRAAQAVVGVVGTPSVGVTASIGGADPRGLVLFARELQKKLPLSEVKKINISGDTATVEVNFFYKPFDTSKTGLDNIPPRSSSDTKLLEQLKDWEE